VKELLSCLPESYRDSPETVDLLQAVQRQVKLLGDQYESFLRQTQVSAATWGLSIWEETYGVPVDVSKSQQERREVLYARMRAIGSVTPAMIQNIAAAFCQGNPVVTEFPNESRFTISVIQSLDRPTSLKGMYAAIEGIKPAHLQAGYEACYLPAVLEEKETIFLSDFGAAISFWNGYGSASIRLNGQRRLDGSWLLDQAVPGVAFQLFAVADKWQNTSGFSGTLTIHVPFYLDGGVCLDGSKKLNGGITKEEI
jgi:hypothetical protein